MNVKCTNPDCTASYQVPEEFLGKVVRCKKCNTKFTVSDSNGAPAKKGSAGSVPATALEKAPSFKKPAPASDEPKPAAGGKRWYIAAGIGALGVCFCLFGLCIVGAGGAYMYLGGRAAETYGGIEISSTTVKASVVKFYADPDFGFNYTFLSEDEMQVTTNLEKVGPTGDTDAESLDKTVSATASFFKDLQSKHGVAPGKIVIVASSGAFKSLNPARVQINQDNLRTRILAETKRNLEIVSLEQEIELQIKSLIPEKEMDRTLLVDLGNSLCRGGGYDTTLKRYTIFNPKIGVKGFHKLAEKDAGFRGYKGFKTPEQRKLFADTSLKTVDIYFRDPLAKEMSKTNEINGRKRIELVGGTPWVTATYKNPSGRAKKHTKLTKQDIDDFYMDVRRDLAYPTFNMPKGIDEPLTKMLRTDVDNMEKRISVENLIAGTEMLRVLSEELTFQHREVYFNNNGQKALVLGFMTKLWEQGKK